jgi:hypothetical protein
VLTSEGSGASAHWTPKSSSTFATYYNNTRDDSPLLTQANKTYVFSHTYPITVAANSRLVISANFMVISPACFACPPSENILIVLVNGTEVQSFFGFMSTGNGLEDAATISNFMYDIGPGTYVVAFKVLHPTSSGSDSYVYLYTSSIMVLPQ